MKTAYKAILLGLLVNDTKVNIGFKTEGFVIPGHGVIDVKELVESEKEKLEKIAKAKKDEKEELLAELVLPDFIGKYLEKKATSGLFDILSEEEAAEVSIGESKLDLASQLEEKAHRVAELEKELAELKKGQGAAKEPEPENE